jgi:hypothetical protein
VSKRQALYSPETPAPIIATSNSVSFISVKIESL